MRLVLHRDFPEPEILLSREADKARQEVVDFLERGDDERATRRAPLNERLIRNDQVRKALIQLFLGKCAYCEQTHKTLEVEHYRPPANAGGSRQKLPHHYSWLAYDWENLLLACGDCSRRKGSQFPVRRGRAGLLDSLFEIRSQESPHLLDPGFDFPERHLDFTLDGICHPRSGRGSATIQLLQLNRSGLVDRRRQVFNELTEAVEGSVTTRDVLHVFQSMDAKRPFSGALQILRYRYASALGQMVKHHRFAFGDVVGEIDDIHEKATRDAVRRAFQTLEQPRDDVRRRMAAQYESEGWEGPTRPIRHVEIRNFKGIRALNLDMPEYRPGSSWAGCTMILGENATGKSSILQAITLALAGSEIANSLGLDAGKFVRKPEPEESDPQPAFVKVEFAEGPPAELYIDPEESFFQGTEHPSGTVQAYGSRRLFRRARRRKLPGERILSLFDPLWLLPAHRSWLTGLSGTGFKEAARALRQILSLPDQSEFAQVKGSGANIVVDGRATPIEEHSDGYRSLYGIGVDIMQELRGSAPDLGEVRGVVLIDEIETHLHPRWKMRVMSALREALPRVQFIATTHDPLCLRGMEEGEVEVLVRDGADVRRIEGLPSVRGMRAEQLLTSEFFGLGSTDPETDAKLVRYQLLAAKQVLRPEERHEKDELGEQLQTEMKVGDTLTDQIISEALRRADIDPFQPIAKVQGRTREEMVAALAARIDDIEAGFARPDA